MYVYHTNYSFPDEDLESWSDEDFAPIPVKFELTPVVNLFTMENLDEKQNVSSAKILEW